MMNEYYSTPDPIAYDIVWGLIEEVVEKDYKSNYVLSIKKNAKQIVWDNYCYFNRLCKLNYMENPYGVLDRHKVAACYMFAIINANLISCEVVPARNTDKELLINERLAVTIGMTILRSLFIKEVVFRNPDPEKQKELKQKIDSGIKYPICNHGKYLDNFVSELYFTRMEHNFNILSLANELYLLECLTVGETNPTPIEGTTP